MVTGHVDGDLQKVHNELGEVSFDVNFEKFQGDNDPWLDGKHRILRKMVRAMIFSGNSHTLMKLYKKITPC
ncbi:hypothetical protein JK635_05425 [Neobacillus sp. YIM B02564]|uniref:Uncharacterized protein n=1 Tax=Neobacillus paridis TaxID=2803862 RepID=A0ABS1TKZ3_9BACI|nr:hypothetical protein [Neobacillus paridis]MBL4951679.1 hypothetical protein [Neobacillus paridis]